MDRAGSCERRSLGIDEVINFADCDYLFLKYRKTTQIGNKILDSKESSILLPIFLYITKYR